MDMTYPVQGYRTKDARARGFQKRLPSNLQVERLLRDALNPPWGPRRMGQTSIPRRFGRVTLGGAINAIPAVRVPRLALRLAVELLQTARQDQAAVSEGWAPEPDGGWQVCGQCPLTFAVSHARHSSGAPSAATCKQSADCLAGQGTSGWQPVSDVVVPAGSRTLLYGHWYVSGAGLNRIRRITTYTREADLPATAQVWNEAQAAVLGRPAVPMVDVPGFPRVQLRERAIAEPRLERDLRVPGRVQARDEPPGPGVRERKMRLMQGGALRRAVEMAYEGEEWVGIVHGALPKDCQAAFGSTTFAKAKAVYKCWDRLDPCKFVEGVINNAVEDYIIGVIGGAAKAEAERMLRPYGLSGLTRKLGHHAKAPPPIPKISLHCGTNQQPTISFPFLD